MDLKGNYKGSYYKKKISIQHLVCTVFFMYAFLRKTKKYEYLLCIFLSAQEGIHEEDCTRILTVN